MGMSVDPKRLVVVSHALRGYGFGLLQDFDNVLTTIEKNGITLDEFRTFMKLSKNPRFHHQEAQEAGKKAWVAKLPKCPDGYPMIIRAAGPDESIWYCHHCAYSTYNDKSWQEVLGELEEEVRNGLSNDG